MPPNDLPPPDELPAELEADLAAYADGRLEAARASALEARFAEEPALAAAAERQRQAADLIVAAAGSVEAPTWLRIELDAAQARSRRAVRKRRPWLSWRPLAGLAAAAAVLALVLVVTLGGSGLTVQEAAAFGTQEATAVVLPDPANPKLLTADVEGVQFPDYAAKFGWRAAGQRTDEDGGRRLRTVFYERAGERIAYAIVAGDPLDEPEDAVATKQNGVSMLSLASDGRTIVTWLRVDHTCVLSGEGVSAATLRELAAWRGKGSIDF